MNIDFDNLNMVQKSQIKHLFVMNKEKRERLKVVTDQFNNYKNIHEITNDIVIVELNNPFNDEELSKHESYFEAYVNGKRVLSTGTFALDSAILVALAHKHGDPSAYKYTAKLLNMDSI